MDGVDRSRKNALVSGSKRRSKQRFEEEHTERVSGNQRGMMMRCDRKTNKNKHHTRKQTKKDKKE